MDKNEDMIIDGQNEDKYEDVVMWHTTSNKNEVLENLFFAN